MTKTKFNVGIGRLSFSVIYIIDAEPHLLLFGCSGFNLFFTIEVMRGFHVSPYLGCYNELVKALGLEFDPNNRYTPTKFFMEFNQKIPQSTSLSRAPTITDIARLSHDVEDADKIYFLCWKNHDGATTRPTPRNLEKTKRLCGVDVYHICETNHISSCWTDDSNQEKPFTRPSINLAL